MSTPELSPPATTNICYNRVMKPHWQPIVKARSSVLFQWYVFEGHKERYFRSSLGLNAGFTNHKIVSDEIFADQNEWAKLEKTLTTKVESDPDFFERFIRLCYQHSDELIGTSKQLGQIKNWEKLKNNELLSLYKKYQNSILNLMPFLNGTLVMDTVLKKEITNTLETDLGIIDENKQELLLSKLVVPGKKSYFVQETEDLLKMALKVQKNKKASIKEDIQKYLGKYAWMPSIAYLNPFLTGEDVMKKVRDLLKENPQERLTRIGQIKKETWEDYKKALNQIEGSKKLVGLIGLARDFIFLQTYRFDVFSLAHYYAYPLLEEISRRFNLKVEEIIYLTGEEIVNLLEGKAEVDKEEIKNRIRNYTLVKEGDKYTLLSGNKVEEVVTRIVKETTVRGMVASRGRARGTAKLVKEVDDIPKVNKGDIIVSPMTHPKLVPAIIKSVGIITDFGGMLCHAAIVSREFGIPCIVGTKNATKVFKDGDLMELNAYDGTAWKL